MTSQCEACAVHILVIYDTCAMLGTMMCVRLGTDTGFVKSEISKKQQLDLGVQGAE